MELFLKANGNPAMDRSIISSYYMVYTCFVTFQQIVAVKELNDNDDTMFLTEFLKEASVMLHLRHPNIIRMYGVILSPIRLVCEVKSLLV